MCDMYRCLDCGNIFKAEDARIVEECVGEFWGAPAYERWDACPECVSTDLEEYEPLECWVSYYLNDGTQCNAIITVNGAYSENIYDEIKEHLKKEHGDHLGEIDDYETVDDMTREDE